MLTKQVAVKFLEESLGIEDVESKAKNSKLLLLSEFTERFHRCIPFQNLTIISKQPDERRFPSLDDVKQEILDGHGGLCYTHSSFTHHLFTTLGYHSYPIACSVPNGTNPYTHISTIVSDVVHDGDAYLVDVGAGFPSFEPIPIRQLPRHYKQAFLEFKFVTEGNNICRYHRIGDHLGKLRSAVDSDGWQMFYSFEEVPRSDEFLERYQTPIYTEPNYGAGWYLTNLKMSLYPRGKAVSLSNNVLKVWDEETSKLEVSETLDFTQLESRIQQYFPMLHQTDVRRALEKLKAIGTI